MGTASWRTIAALLFVFVGSGVSQDKVGGDKAIKELLPLAQKGDRGAQAGLCFLYAYGLGVPENPKEAFRWCRSAAEKGDAEAQYDLATLYKGGRGVEQNLDQAITWFRRSALQGDASAETALGEAYEIGMSLEQNQNEADNWYKRALQHYRKAADSGDVSAMVHVGEMYEYGRGVLGDLAEAFKWYRQAASNGDDFARSRIQSDPKPQQGQQYAILTVAGGIPPTTPSLAQTVPIGEPQGIAQDSSGNVYFTSMNCVFKVDRNGVLTRVAGTSGYGYAGDDGPARSAEMRAPTGLAVDKLGNVYVADSSNYRIRRISRQGVITTVAGTGTSGYSGDGGQATKAQLTSIHRLVVDAALNIYIEDLYRIRKISADGIITTVVGTGQFGSAGDSGPATLASVGGIRGIALDATGSLYITDTDSIRRVSRDGIITTVARVGGFGMGIDAVGNIYVGGSSQIERISSDGTVAAIHEGDPLVNSISDMSVDASGILHIIHFRNSRIHKLTPGQSSVVFAGSALGRYSGDGGPAIQAQLDHPHDVALGPTGDIYVADEGNSRVRKISSKGVITTIAGNGMAGDSGDGGSATSARLADPIAVAVDDLGNVYLADYKANRVRRVSPAGIITTVAGTGEAGYSGDGGPATAAQLNSPFALAVGAGGVLYIADQENHRVRRVSADGRITTVAGSGQIGYAGDGGPATKAQFYRPSAVAVARDGSIYIADRGNECVRKVSADGIVTTVAGTGEGGYSGDGNAATKARLSQPSGITVDNNGNVYIADRGNMRIRKISPDGTITTIAGIGLYGSASNRRPATSSPLAYPTRVAVDVSGNVYVADSENDAIRLLKPLPLSYQR